MSRSGFTTKAVQSGELRDTHMGSVVTPLFQASTFLYPNDDPTALTDRIRKEPYIYSRWNNPTTQSLELKYSAIEGSKFALGFSSGMAAIASSVLALTKKHKRILSVEELYGQTHGVFENLLPQMGIGVDFISIDRFNSLDFKGSGYDLVYTESVVNPTLRVSDISTVSKVCREQGVPLVVDATFSSPYNQRPLELGASVVIHSATKYISGHSDTIYGLASTDSESTFMEMQNLRRQLGSNPDPFQSFLVARGAKTLGLRMERHNINGMEIAKALSAEAKVKRVNYPGLESFIDHHVAERNLSGYGGMISFELEGGLEKAKKFVKHLKIPVIASSLGGVESLVSLPIETSHRSIDPKKRHEMGIGDGLIRFSTGIEDTEDLIADVQQALSAT
ncbi:MAG: PLP-dependent transferase [Candidatus Thermoplasmatota archaeon]|nr:PLP-dependent transferase [Candidatus Thermoplasmatota archaeon]